MRIHEGIAVFVLCQATVVEPVWRGRAGGNHSHVAGQRAAAIYLDGFGRDAGAGTGVNINLPVAQLVRQALLHALGVIGCQFGATGHHAQLCCHAGFLQALLHGQ